MSDVVTNQNLKRELDDFAVKLFRYLDERFKNVDQQFEQQDEKTGRLTGAVDAYAKQVEIYQQESLARDAQMARLERWIEQVAQKTGVKLEY